MKHLTQEQIVLHCYGDASDGETVERHLGECGECRAEFEKVKTLLREIPAVELPEPPAYLEQKLWLNLRDRLELETSPAWRRFLAPSRWAIAAAVAVLVIGAFVAGRFWPRQQQPTTNAQVQVNPQRVVLVAVGDHLERSQMLLIELMNTGVKDWPDLSEERQQARDLLDDNRLYRVSAQRSGDPAVAHLLDELERVLVEVANSPDQPTAGDVREIRKRIESQDLLFKIQVVGSKVTKPASPSDQRL